MSVGDRSLWLVYGPVFSNRTRVRLSKLKDCFNVTRSATCIASLSFFLSSCRCFFLTFSSSFFCFTVLHFCFPSSPLFPHPSFFSSFVLSFHSLFFLSHSSFLSLLFIFLPTLPCFISSCSLIFFLITSQFLLPSHICNFPFFFVHSFHSFFMFLSLFLCLNPTSTAKTEQQVPSKRRHSHAGLHGVITYRTTI